MDDIDRAIARADKLKHEAFISGKYECYKCGALMKFEDKWEHVLICPACGHEVEFEMYGFEGVDNYDDIFRRMYPTLEELEAEEGDIEEEDEYTGEVYDDDYD